MLNLSVTQFLRQLASDAPAPGGGSASALAGALAAALVSMVANLTEGKEKFTDVEADMIQLNQNAGAIRQQLMALMEEDTKAFQQVMAAFRLPKETSTEKERRQAQIQAAMIHAAEVPLKTAKTALKVLELAKIAAQKGNPNAASDAGVAALLAWAAIEGAALNVKINLGSIKDEKICQDLEAAVNGIVSAANTLTGGIVANVKSVLS
jgi:formiminotetrahydrofolate cyclodeaminase